MEEEAVSHERKRRGTLVLRVLPLVMLPLIIIVAVSAVLRLITGQELPPPPPTGGGRFPIAPFIVFGVFIVATITLVRLQRPTISALLLIGFWTLQTTFVGLSGGVTSFLPALMTIPILAAGLLFDRQGSIITAVVASALVICFGGLQYYDLLPPDPFLPGLEPQSPMTFLSIGFWIGLFWTIAWLTSLLSNDLQSALHRSRGQAAELATFSAQLEVRVQQQTATLLSQAQEKATLEERTRLARDIHDTLAQGLTGVVVQLGAAQRGIEHIRPQLDSAIAADLQTNIRLAQQMARESLAEARRSVWNLRAPLLERGDLGDALHTLAIHSSRQSITVQFLQRGEPWPLTPQAETALLRVTQESLANVAKHAQASQATIVLDYERDAVRLTIADNGCGFPADVFTRPEMYSGPFVGFGLLGMRERLSALGGTLDLCNRPGAEVSACIPRESPLAAGELSQEARYAAGSMSSSLMITRLCATDWSQCCAGRPISNWSARPPMAPRRYASSAKHSLMSFCSIYVCLGGTGLKLCASRAVARRGHGFSC
ncbi:sensor histidine kinase [Candidatus Gracilibacteria bacterium]|nr:sensor histidine kinase [Candidatus Gracilibacteria bacterium]